MNGRADVSTSGTTDSEIIDHENMNMIRIDQIGTPSIVSDAIMDLKTRASTCPIENTQPWHIFNNSIYHTNTNISMIRLKVK